MSRKIGQLARPLRLLVVISALSAACASSEGAGGGDAGDAGATDVPEVSVGPACQNSDECPGQFCDKRHGGCVDCYTTRHCPDGQICRRGACTDQVPCDDETPCESGVCLGAGVCEDCFTPDDCGGDWRCVDRVCRPPFDPCEEPGDCSAVGAVCSESTGRCASCTDDSRCGDYEVCEDGECVPELCVPGNAACVGDAIQICRADAEGYSLIRCEEGQTCFAGQCVHSECTPNTSWCEKYRVKECTADGILRSKNCPPGQECQDGACAPMRHRVLVVFDTSGSMNWPPGSDEWPPPCGQGDTEGCFTPWPECEDPDAPFTKAGISKKVFGQFFQSDAARDVVFGLARFPQYTGAGPPICEGGYYLGETEVTGDDGSETLPLGETTWLDESLGEVLLVPFPEATEESNLYEMLQWMDGKEVVTAGEETCFKNADCESGLCLGAAGFGKRCQTFENPEVRADGWTPLGKSLFYAGEYLRREVVIDGQPCGADADCESPGYYCSAGGRCFDPLRPCRLNVILLFTDGEETQHPFPNEYFNPRVQAKRMRFGLGCTTDEDCSSLDYCNNSGDTATHGCFPNYCHPDGYCTNDAIESDVAFDPVDLVAGDAAAQRLVDYNGNGIDIVVNVVDASIADPTRSPTTLNDNRLIALYGGGQHVVVNVDDAPNFLAALRNSIDFKTLFTQCATGPVEPD